MPDVVDIRRRRAAPFPKAWPHPASAPAERCAVCSAAHGSKLARGCSRLDCPHTVLDETTAARVAGTETAAAMLRKAQAKDAATKAGHALQDAEKALEMARAALQEARDVLGGWT